MPEPRKNEQAVEAGAQEKFLGLAGFWKQFANFGIAGVLCAITIYLVAYLVPSMHEHFHDEMRLEREASRIEAQKSRDHGNQVGKDMTDAIREQTRVIDSHQTAVRENQKHLIDLLFKKN